MPELIAVIVYISIYIGLVATTFYILSFFADKKRERLFFKDSELPFVSVIIPAYNEERSIAKTIESALASDYFKNKFEVIVVDDGSEDKTLEISRRFEGKQVRVFHKKNGGKGTALNFGIKRARGDVVFSMDADTFVNPESMKNMVRYFKNPEVMAVTPAMLIHNPKSVLQRVQHMEYLLGLFLRKVFAALNSIYITPGAFSAYRKTFFDKYGGYDEGNITEDLEMSLRIQYQGYSVENCPDAPVYTIAPSKFKELLVQRRRWYFGLIKNLIKYKKVFSKKYGDLGFFVLPISLIGVFFAVFVTVFLFVKTLFDIKKELIFLQSINFDFGSFFGINSYILERFLFLFFSNPIVIFVMIFIVVVGFYLHYAAKKVGKSVGLIFNLFLFFTLFSILFGFWWIVSLFFLAMSKTVRWR